MQSFEIRSRFLKFFEKRGHAIIPSASLVTSDEKGITNATLFNTAGMQPLVPYLLGKPYLVDGQEVKRLVNVQKSLRTVDIDDIGDKTHATFFEMLGNWSLGGPPEGYFKKEAINWSYEFLTDKKDGLGLDPNRLYVTVFEGDENVPCDDEAAQIWREIFTKNNINPGGDTRKGELGRIFYLPAVNNWWEAGENGPCGPDTEMFFDVFDKSGKFRGGTITKDDFVRADASRELVEVWNDVFMQYEKRDGKIIGKLPKPSVDTGAGLERLAMTLQGVDNIYDTDLLKPVMEAAGGYIEYELGNEYFMEGHYAHRIKSQRIIADHMKASVFLVGDGVLPSNTDRGYVLRKLIRRAVRHADSLPKTNLIDVIVAVQNQYKTTYPNVMGSDEGISVQKIIHVEELKFRETLKQGLKEFEKLAVKDISAHDAFSLFASYGFPLELTIELSKEKGIKVDTAGFEAEFKKHQELSRTGTLEKFKGGLADANDPMIVRYHTATHLLHQALHDVLGENQGNQKGSNITAERLRFDFSFGEKMTDEQKKRVEDIVNEKIVAGLPMNNIVMSRDEAENTGARQFFGEKYGDQISIYFIGQASNPPVANDLKNSYSKEFCGGPHVKNTHELTGPEGKWKFKITKEEAISQGVRRIKAVLI